ncbi:unnamed protein product [Aphis gossypii]|uniref:Uncharacterized protein n=1 Tax=Aphis gossypii TaxID=80765 RepID=A0A9P0NHQ7_APHGO|nr:unnamed protein product [Aphis gossypii]
MVARVGRSRSTSRWGAVLRGVDYRETPISRARARSLTRETIDPGRVPGTVDEDIYDTLIIIYNIVLLRGCVRRILRHGLPFFPTSFPPILFFFPFCFRSCDALFSRISRIARWRVCIYVCMCVCVCVREYRVSARKSFS